jgi:hypothetical protein
MPQSILILYRPGCEVVPDEIKTILFAFIPLGAPATSIIFILYAGSKWSNWTLSSWCNLQVRYPCGS